MTALALEFRTAQFEDLPVVLATLKDAALWLESKRVDQWQNYIEPDQAMRGWIEQGVADQEVHLVYFKQKAIATLRLLWADLRFWPAKNDGLAGYIHSFAVVTEFRNQKIGDQVLQWVEAECRRRKKKYLRLDCSAYNPALQQYYLNHGFRALETRAAQGYLNVFFEKDLGERN